MNKVAWVLVILLGAATATGFYLFNKEATEHRLAEAQLAEAREQTKAAERQSKEALDAASKQQAAALDELRKSHDAALADLKAQQEKALETVRTQNKKETDELKQQQDQSDRRNAAERELDRKRQAIERLGDEFKASAVSLGKADAAFKQGPTQETFAAYTGSLADVDTKFKRIVTLATEARDYVTTNPDLEPATREKALKNKEDTEKAMAQLTPVMAMITKARTGIRQADFDVQANEEWQSFPLQVAEGETVCVQASGRWRWGRNIGGLVGAGGENGDASYRIVSDLGNGALVARVQGLADLFAACPSFTPRRGGTLQFQINDSQVRDNTGSLSLHVWILPNPK